MKFSAIKNKSVNVAIEYFDDTINIGVLVNSYNEEIETQLEALTTFEEDSKKMTLEEKKKRTRMFAEIIEQLVNVWDVEDKLPDADAFDELGIIFMTMIYQHIQSVFVPEKKA